MELREVVFRRIFALREDVGLSRQEFVDTFNEYLRALGNPESKKISVSAYRMMEHKHSTTSEILIFFINFYASQYNINPAWIITQDNIFIEKSLIRNETVAENHELKRAVEEVKSILKKL